LILKKSKEINVNLVVHVGDGSPPAKHLCRQLAG
jgi:hypothetical protein